MKKTLQFLAALVLISFCTLSSCQKGILGNDQNDDHGGDGKNKPHHAQVFLTDHQTPLFDSVFIDIQQLEIKVEDDNFGNEGWVVLDIRPGIYNILRFRNGIDTLFANGLLPNANIRKLRLTLGMQNSVMFNNQSSPLKIHDNDRQIVIDLADNDFEIVGPDQVVFSIDFDAAGSIRSDNSGPGNNNGFELKPHIKAFAKNKSGRIEGKVLPMAADVMVMAINGTDTTMAIPDDEDGEFKIVGLNAGIYTVFIDGQNGYVDMTINNVQVIKGEDTHIPTITLHQ